MTLKLGKLRIKIMHHDKSYEGKSVEEAFFITINEMIK
jgi:hypothetical protein